MSTDGIDDGLRTEIWAQLLLRNEDSLRIRDFFDKETGIKISCVSSRMHLTVYFAIGRMPGVDAWSPSPTCAGSSSPRHRGSRRKHFRFSLTRQLRPPYRELPDL